MLQQTQSFTSFCKRITLFVILSHPHHLDGPRLPTSDIIASTIWRTFNTALFREHFIWRTWQCTASRSTKLAGGISTLFISEPPPRQVGQFWTFPLLLNSTSVTRSPYRLASISVSEGSICWISLVDIVLSILKH